ncbi:GRB10-interacting GYF protein 2-like [Sardina pilchardus]|uniref:GRB10-interacting GYF protein 2-like n=1 Tax=Sardina pilchardus TaxID=27697 RepID=UPI002E12246C
MASSCGSAALRLVLLGPPGAGKSTAANAILGRDVFPECVTTKSSVQTQIIGGTSISLIDTPRCLMSSTPSDGGVPSGEDLEECLRAAAPGPHAFLLVVPLGSPLSAELTGAVEWIGRRLGEEALRTTVLLFTRRERVTRREWDCFLSRQEVRDVIGRCGGGCHAVNSKAEIEASQVTELLEKVRAVAEKRGGGHYATDAFLAARRRSKAEREDASAVAGREERKWGDMRKEMEMKRQMRQEVKRREEEDKRRREEERRKKEQLELQEKERRRKQREERERVQRERRRLEEEKNRQQQEKRRLEEEERRQEEIRERLEEESKQQEEVARRLEEESRQQEEVARRLEEERRKQEEETQRLVLERRRIQMEQLKEKEENQQVARGGRQQQQQQADGWKTAERCAAVAGAFLAPFFRR